MLARNMSWESLLTTPWWEEYRSAVQSSETRGAKLYVRSHAPTPGGHETRRRVFRNLDSAIAQKSLDTYDVTIVGEGLCLCDCCIERPPGRQLVETFSAARDRTPDSVDPVGFEERVVDSTITGEHHRVLVPPELCLTLTADGELVGVFPCRIDGTLFSVPDFLDVLTAEPARPALSRADA
jgi:hypothetical protein